MLQNLCKRLNRSITNSHAFFLLRTYSWIIKCSILDNNLFYLQRLRYRTSYSLIASKPSARLKLRCDLEMLWRGKRPGCDCGEKKLNVTLNVKIDGKVKIVFYVLKLMPKGIKLWLYSFYSVTKVLLKISLVIYKFIVF